MGLPFENADYNEDQIGATKLTELTDTSINDLQNNNILVYNSTTEKWENQTQSSSVNVINDIGDVNITNIQNGQRLVYNSSNSKWENSTITDNNTDNLNDLTDTNLDSIANNETLIYNTTNSKWENGNINLNYIGDVNINSLNNGEVLKYNSTTSKWENQDNTDNLNELTDVTINSNQNNQVLKYNNTAGVYKNAFVNLTELGDTNISSLANNNILIYKSSSSAWEAGNITYTETDPVFTASPANGITSILIGKWNTAHSWGDHSTEGYLTSFTETDPVFTASPANGITSTLIGKWNTAHSWGDHSIQGYLTSFTETDPVFTAHTTSNISNGNGFLKNNGSGTWSYDNNTYLTSVGIHQLGGLTYADVVADEIIRKSSNTTAEGAGMTLKDTYSSSTTGPFTYKKTISYFGRFGTQTQLFGVNNYTTDANGYNQLLHPNSAYLGTGTGGFYIHSTGGEASNVRVGVNVQHPDETFQVDGSIQIDSANVSKLKFQKTGASPHALCEINAEAVSGAAGTTDGAELQFYTKNVNGNVNKKLTISNKGALGIGATPDYGTPGYFLKTLGDFNSPIWTELKLETLSDVNINLAPGATEPVNGEFLAYSTNRSKWLNTHVLNSIETSTFFNINSELRLTGAAGTQGQLLQSSGSGAAPTWTSGLLIPYYFRAQKSNNQTTTTVNTAIDCNGWVASLPSPYNVNNSDLNANGIEWVCPVDGLYNVNSRLNMYNGNDFLREAVIRLHKQPVGGSYSIVAESLFVTSLNDATDTVTASPQFTDLIPMNTGDKLKISFAFKTTAAGSTLYVFSGTTSVWTITRDAVSVTSSGLPQSLGTTSSPTFNQVNALQYNVNSSDNNMKIIDNTYAGVGNYSFAKGLHIAGSGSHSDLKVGVYRESTVSYSYTFMKASRHVVIEAGSDIWFYIPAGKHLKLNNVNIHQGASDDRIKFNETLVSNGLDVINKVNIYKYDKVYEIGHTPDKNPFKKEVGVIAQEIQKIPELAQAVTVNETPEHSKDKTPNGTPMSVYYDQIHSYHIKATQELHALVKSLEARIKTLEGK